MNLIKKIFEKNISGKRILSLFILTNVVYLFMLLFTIPKTMRFSGGMQLLDMLPTGYNLAYVHDLFTTLGEGGRETYLTYQIPVDMIYPLLFGLSYSLLTAYFLRKLNKLKSPFIYLCLLPVLAGIADYIENVGIIIMLNSYPDLTTTMVKATNTFSVIKSITTSMFFITIITILVLLGINYLKINRARSN